MNKLDANYWNQRYQSNAIGWDLGEVSPPIKTYIDQLEDKSLRILIPGCGNAYEAEYLHHKGFDNVHLLDFASEPLNDFKKRVSDFPESHLHQDDFIQHQGEYDLIIEQTLFCALDPKLRGDYVQSASRLLSPKGKIVGLLFNRHFEGGPPFGGSQSEYEELFSRNFKTISMELCYNSIEPRKGSELFIQIAKD